MCHYDNLREEEYCQSRQRKMQYLVGMIKSGKYDEYINFCHSNNFQTVQVPIEDLTLLIEIVKSRL